MRIYVVGKVLEVTEPVTFKMPNGKSEYPKATAIIRTRDEASDNYLAIDVFGEEKIQRLVEAQVSGVPQEMIVTIASRKWESDKGKSGYSTYLNLKYVFGSIQ